MRKKVIILLLCAVLALSGCGGTNSQSGGSQTSASIAAKDRLSPEEYRSKLLEVMQERGRRNYRYERGDSLR